MVAFGLLDQAQSDDEVAFILAHELGHLRLGHFAKGAREARQAQLTSRLGELYVIGSAARSGVSSLRSGGNSSADRVQRDGGGTRQRHPTTFCTS